MPHVGERSHKKGSEVGGGGGISVCIQFWYALYFNGFLDIYHRVCVSSLPRMIPPSVPLFKIGQPGQFPSRILDAEIGLQR